MQKPIIIKQSQLKEYLAGVSDEIINRWTQKGIIPSPKKIGKLKFFHLQQVKERIDCYFEYNKANKKDDWTDI